MSLNITSGVYKIFNVAYPNQVADLLYPGGVNGTIGGFRNNDGSKRNQWQANIEASGTGFVELNFVNQEITTFAGIFQTGVNESLVGNPTQNLTWHVTAGSDAGDEYSISHIWHFATYGWTLPDGRDETGITVEQTGSAPAKNQLWKLVPVPER